MIGPLTKRLLWVMFLGLVAIWLQGAVLRSFIPDYGIIPNFIVIMVVYLAFYEVSSFGALLAFLLGLEFDILSGVRIGPWAGACVLVFGLLACFAQRMFVESAMATAVAVFFSSLVASVVYLLCTYELHPFTSSRIWFMGIEALLTAVLAPFLFKFLRRALRRRELVPLGHLG